MFSEKMQCHQAQKATRLWWLHRHFRVNQYCVNLYILRKEVNHMFNASMNLCLCSCLSLNSFWADRQTPEKKSWYRERGGKHCLALLPPGGSLPAHLCVRKEHWNWIRVAGDYCVNNLSFCLLHHLFLPKGGFDLCIHLNSKEAKNTIGW